MNTENIPPAVKPGEPHFKAPAAAAGESSQKKKHEEEALDEGLEESFPASDPVAISISKPRQSKEKLGKS